MTDVNVNADLLVEDGLTDRQLNVDDFKTPATGAATETTMLEVLAAVAGQTSATRIRRVAGMDLSGDRLVVPQLDDSVVYATNADVADMGLPIWLTTSAALADDSVELLTFGEFTEGPWSWTPGALYLGTGGQLTQTPPSAPAAAFLLQVALATSATDIFFNPKTPIVLA